MVHPPFEGWRAGHEVWEPIAVSRLGGSLYDRLMSIADPHQAVLRRQWDLEAERLEQRRRHLLSAAEKAAQALRSQWPAIHSVWLFGSARNPGGFRRHSDLDLAVEGLLPAAQGAALGLVEQVVDPLMGAAGEPGCGIDLVRLEDLDPHWRERIRQRGQRLA